MASVFQPTIKGKKSEKWFILFTDEHGKRRKKIGYVSKRDTERLAMKLEERAAKIRNGDLNPKDEAYRVHEGRPLPEHLVDFGRYLIAKGGSAKHAEAARRQISRVVELAKVKRISDLTLSKAIEAIGALRGEGLGQETLNHHSRAVKAFSRWLWRDGRAREHHLAHLTTSSAEGDRRHVRRALTLDEAARVVQAAEAGPDSMGMTGPDRAVLYAVALGTGFRAEELRTLTPELFKLDSDRPTVTARACYTKNGREAVQPIAMSLADRLRPWLATKPPGRPVFEGMHIRTAEMLRRDLKAAGIPYETDSGVADFHSLRGCYISYLVSSGASVKTCQTLARHSTPSLTIGVYAKASLHDIGGAVEALPDLTTRKPQPEALRMTGTDPVATRSATLPLESESDPSTQVITGEWGSVRNKRQIEADTLSDSRELP
jgi:site-specific recombinase XerC